MPKLKVCKRLMKDNPEICEVKYRKSFVFICIHIGYVYTIFMNICIWMRYIYTYVVCIRLMKDNSDICEIKYSKSIVFICINMHTCKYLVNIDIVSYLYLHV